MIILFTMVYNIQLLRQAEIDLNNLKTVSPCTIQACAAVDTADLVYKLEVTCIYYLFSRQQKCRSDCMDSQTVLHLYCSLVHKAVFLMMWHNSLFLFREL